MVLETDVTLVVLATYVEDVLIRLGHVGLGELAVVDLLLPLRGPEVIFNYRLAVLVVNNSTFVNHDLGGIPLTCRLGVLRICRDDVIQRSALAVAVATKLSVGVI